MKTARRSMLLVAILLLISSIFTGNLAMAFNEESIETVNLLSEVSPVATDLASVVTNEVPKEEVVPEISSLEKDITLEADETTPDVVEAEVPETPEAPEAPVVGEVTEDVATTEEVPLENKVEKALEEPPITIKANGEPKEVAVNITHFSITKTSGADFNNDLYINTLFRLNLNWDASSHGATLKEGDYFTITIPNEFKLYDKLDFNLMAPDGTSVMARADVTVGEGGVGGIIKVTFTDYVNEKENIKGNLWLRSNFNEKIVKVDEPNEIIIKIGEYTSSVTVTPGPAPGPTPGNKDEVLAKWSHNTLDVHGNVEWVVRLNYAGRDESQPVTITDEITALNGVTPVPQFVPGSFVLKQVKYNDPNHPTSPYGYDTNNVVILPVTPIFSENNTKFTIEGVDFSGGKQYRLEYKTTYPVPKMSIKNKLTVSIPGESGTSSVTFTDQSGGGSGSGDITNKIKIVKVDKDDEIIKLPNAEFLVTKVDGGQTFTLVTNENGEVISETLSLGEYKVIETKAPNGYILNGEEFTVNLTADGFILTVKNEKIPTPTVKVNVEKKWEGQPLETVTIRLLANGVEKETVVLNNNNNWKHTFEKLPKLDDKNVEIVYTITEDALANYSTSITSESSEDNSEKSFIVTNKFVPVPEDEKIDISVTKRWVGRISGPVTVNLYADGLKINSVLVTESMGWRYTFRNLNVFNGDKRIVYTVDENYLPGYIVRIDGSVENGFVILNSEIPYIPPIEPPIYPPINPPVTPPVTPPVVPEIPPVTPPVTPPEVPEIPPETSEKPEIPPNTGNKPEIPPETGNKPNNAVPKTGDEFNALFYVSLLVVSAVALGAYVSRNRRKSN